MVVGAGFRWVNELHAVKGERWVPSVCLFACFLWWFGGAVRGLTRYHSGCALFFLFFPPRGRTGGVSRGMRPKKNIRTCREVRYPRTGNSRNIWQKNTPAYPSRPFRFAKPLFWDIGLVLLCWEYNTFRPAGWERLYHGV